jgi:hypothetical protein
MEKYIFYTFDGYTIAPNGKQLDNLQILGIEESYSLEDAYKKLFANNPFIKENQFSEYNIKYYRVVE